MRLLTLSRFLAGSCLAAVTAATLGAADQPDGEARLRETLRSTMLQLNDAQSQLAALQAAQAAETDGKKTLTDQVARLTKRVVDGQAAAMKETESLKAKVAESQAENASLQREAAPWKAAAEKASAVARSEAGRREKAAAAALAFERHVEDLSAKNAELFRIGSEILDRYEKFGVGAQFLAREPFVGRARVELENQIQDYDDKLMEQRESQ